MSSKIMRFAIILFGLVLVSVLAFSPSTAQEATATPSETPTETATATSTPSETPTETASPTATPAPSETPTAISTPTETATETATATQQPSATPTESATATLKNTATPSETPTSTATETYTPSPTFTATIPPNVLMPNSSLTEWYQENNPFISYTGAWSRVPDTEANGGYYQHTEVANSEMQFAFYGRGFILQRLTNSNNGNMQVCVDGVCETVSNSSGSIAWQVPFWKANLSLAVHQVLITNLQTRFNPDAIHIYGDYINLIEGNYEAESLELHLYGKWNPSNSTTASNGVRLNSVTSNAEYAFTFTGQQLSLVRHIAASGTYSDMYICIDAACQTVSNTTATNRPQGEQRRATFSDLGEGSHLVTVRALGTKPINLDRIEVYNDPQEVLDVSANWYEEDHPYLNYTGSWTLSSYTSASGTASYTSAAAGNSLNFRFEGTGFGLKRETNSTRGNLNVCVDGLCEIVPNVSSSQQWQAALWRDNLPFGVHEVLITTQDALEFRLDAVLIFSNPTRNPLPVGNHEETNTDIDLLGTWSLQNSANASGGSYRQSALPGNMLAFEFTGTHALVYRTTTASYIRVCVDGDCFIYQTPVAEAWTSGLRLGPYPQGTHSVQITTLSPGTFYLDHIEVYAVPGIDICLDLSDLAVNTNVEVANRMYPGLTMTTTGGGSVVVNEGQNPLAYNPGTYGMRYGFTDIGRQHDYTFTFTGMELDAFSVWVLDFGDNQNGNVHKVTVSGYNANNTLVDQELLQFNYALNIADATAHYGQPGNYLFSVTGEEMTRIQMQFRIDNQAPHVSDADSLFGIAAVCFSLADALALEIPATAASYTENQAPVAVISSATITGSSTITGATITLTNPLDGDFELLNATEFGSIDVLPYNPTTGVLQLTGADSPANYELVLESLSYVNNSEAPNQTPRSINIILQNGAETSPVVTATVNVVPVNDLPLVSSTDSPTYSEDSLAVLVIPNAIVSDLDDTELTNASISLTNLMDTGLETITVDESLANGAGIAVDDSVVGLITLTGTTSLSNYQLVLRTLSYRNLSQNPSNVIRTIAVQVSDGTDNGTANFNLAVLPINDRPILQLTSANATYVEGATPVLLIESIPDASPEITDLDDINIESANILLMNRPDGASERLSATGQFGITPIYDPATGLLSLTGSATLAQYETVLASLSYENTSTSPDNTVRQLAISLSDGELYSLPVSLRVSVQGQSNAPLIILDADGANSPNFNISYIEGDGAKPLADTDASVTDADSDNLVAMTIRISNLLDGASEILHLEEDPDSSLEVTYSLGLILIRGVASVEEYEQLLLSLTYSNISENPSLAERVIEVIAADGTNNSTPVYARVNLAAALDDAPILNLDLNNSGSFSPNFAQEYIIGGAPVAVGDIDLSVIEPDGQNIVSASIVISNTIVDTGDSLSVVTTDTNIVAAPYTNGVLNLSGAASAADYLQVLSSLRFSNSSASPSLEARSIQITVSDNSLTSNLVTSTISLVPSNLPADMFCLSWQTGSSMAWVDSAPVSILWDANGMYGAVANQVVTARFTYPDSTIGEWAFAVQSNGLGSFEVLGGATFEQVLSPQPEGYYLVTGPNVGIRWNTGTSVLGNDSPVFSGYCVDTKPVVNAGEDIVTNWPNNTIELSADIDDIDSGNEDLIITWTVVSGPGGSFSNPNISNPVFTAPSEGVYELLITVSDGIFTTTDTIIVTVTPPVDLTVTEIDTSAFSIDPITLIASGNLGAIIENLTASAVQGSFSVLFFADNNGNNLPDTGETLASTVVDGLAANAILELENIEASGSVASLATRIFVFVDSENLIGETNENNNILSDESQCAVTSPAFALPSLQWSMPSVIGSSTAYDSFSTPLVMDLNDDTLPEIILMAIPVGSNRYTQGVIRILNGTTGQELLTINDTHSNGNPVYFNGGSSLAVGDIDNDGKIEIIAALASNTQVAAYQIDVNASGQLVWAREWANFSVTIALTPHNFATSDPSATPALADLNHDGKSEIIIGRTVLRHDGTEYWKGTKGNGQNMSIVANIDLTGDPEVIAGNTIYPSMVTAGSFLYQNTSLPDGFTGVANFEPDTAQPEIALVGSNKLYILNNQMGVLAGPYNFANTPDFDYGGPPTIANVDADNYLEIGVATTNYYYLLEYRHDTNQIVLQWITENDTADDSDKNVYDTSSNTGSAIFDFNGDGFAEIVYGDEDQLFIFDARPAATDINGDTFLNDANVLWSFGRPSFTRTEMPIVADIDGDDHAELLVVGSPYVHGESNTGDPTGILAFQASDNSWAPARSTWNQHSYHITNIADNGTIPTRESHSWLFFNTYRANVIPDPCETPYPDLAASYLRRESTGTDYVLTVQIVNLGERSIPDGVSVAFYNGDPLSGGTLIDTERSSQALNPGGSTDVSITVPNTTLASPLWAVVDDLGEGVVSNAVVGEYPEFNEDNNFVSSRIYLINGTNAAPIVDAGEDTTWDTGNGEPLALNATVVEDGKPIAYLDLTWTVIQAPEGAEIAFGDDNNKIEDPTVTFSEPGVYQLVLTADDGEFITVSEPITITVTEPLLPEAPTANTPLDLTCLASPQMPTAGMRNEVQGIIPVILEPEFAILTDVTVDYWPAAHPELYDASYILAQHESTEEDDILYNLDTTLLANDSYFIRVTGRKPDGSILNCGSLVTVVGEYKPGRVAFSVTDFTIPLVGLPITVGRNYDSLERNYIGDFGYGWSLALGNPRLEVDPANNVTLTLPNGERRTFFFDPNDMVIASPPAYVNEAGVYGSFTANSCPLVVPGGSRWLCFFPAGTYQDSVSSYTYTDPYGRAFTYGVDGRLQTIEDLSGNILTFDKENGIHSSLTDEYLVDFDRDAQGRITHIRDNMDNLYEYKYDDVTGDLIQVILPPVPNETGEMQTFDYEYQYYTGDLAHLFKSGTDTRGLSIITTAYDVDGRLQYVCDATLVIPAGQACGENEGGSTYFTLRYEYGAINAGLTTITNPDGVTLTQYDMDGNVLSYTDELLRTTEYTYENGEVASVENHMGQITNYSYENGNLTEIWDATNTRIILADYNQHGGLTSLVDPSGTNRQIFYNGQGLPNSASDNLGTIGSFLWDSHGNNTQVTDANGAIISFDYDDYGNLESYTDPRGLVISFEYDDMGRRTVANNLGPAPDYSGYVSRASYDNLGRLMELVNEDANGNILSRTAYRYDGNGNQVAVIQGTEPETRTTTYQYDANNRQIRVDYPDGTYTTSKYDWRGNLEEQRDVTGIITFYNYDEAGQLSDVTFAYTTAAAVTTHYKYDPAGRRTETFEAWGTAEQSRVEFLEYNAAGRVLASTNEAGMRTTYLYEFTTEPRGERVTVTVAAGTGLAASTVYQYDARARLIQTTYPNGTTSTSAYDGIGHVIRSFDAANNQTRYVYDPAGNLTTVTRGYGTSLSQSSSFAYDTLGRQISATNAVNATTQYRYDALGRLIAKCDASVTSCTPANYTRSYAYNQFGEVSGVTDALGNLTSYDYDDMGRLFQTHYADGSFDTNNYVVGRLSSSIVGSLGTVAGVKTSYLYDPAGRLQTARVHYNGSENTFITTTNFSYDLRGRQLSVTDGRGLLTQYRYDAGGRLELICNPTVTLCSQSNYSLRYSYDILGQRIGERDANGNLTSYGYDNMGRLTSITYPHDSATPVDQIPVEYFVYNNLGQRITAEDANGLITEYGYDRLGRLTSVSNPEHEKVNYGYNLVNQLTSIQDANGNTTRFIYNIQGELERKIWPDLQEEHFLYDRNSNLIRHTLADETIRVYYYDEMNRLSREVYEDDTEFGYRYNARGLQIEVLNGDPANAASDVLSTYVYDELGRPLSVTHGEGSDEHAISYAYDANSNRTLQETSLAGTPQSHISYGYDALNRVSSLNDYSVQGANFVNPKTTSFVYDEALDGTLSRIVRPDGLVTNYSYDPYRYFVTEIQHSNGMSSIEGFTYSYDNVGNRLTMHDSRVDDTFSYDYDEAYRLTSVMRDGAEIESYTYDAAGNRLSAERAGLGTHYYSYNANNQIVQIDLGDNYYQDYSYDERGNLTNIRLWGHGSEFNTTFTYNDRDLLETTNAGSVNSSFAYDHDGRRIQQTVGTVELNYLWDEFSRFGDVVLETDGDNALQRRYTLANGALISETDSGGKFYFLSDAQNSTRALVDAANGSVISRFSYDAFGRLTTPPTAAATRYLYAGQQMDRQAGLYSMRARSYDPMTGRFLTRDTWAHNLQNPFELNRYLYVAGNPVNWTDPSGHQGFFDIGAIKKWVSNVAFRGAHGFFKTVWDGTVSGAVGYIGGVLTLLGIVGVVNMGISIANNGFNVSAIVDGFSEGVTIAWEKLVKAQIFVGLSLSMFFGIIGTFAEQWAAAKYAAAVQKIDPLRDLTGLLTDAVNGVDQWRRYFAASYTGAFKNVLSTMESVFFNTEQGDRLEAYAIGITVGLGEAMLGGLFGTTCPLRDIVVIPKVLTLRRGGMCAGVADAIINMGSQITQAVLAQKLGIA